MNDKELLELLKNKSITEILGSKILDEDLFYSLSPDRGNVLSCIDFDSSDDVLEYSYKCYSMTLSYIDKVRSVTKITENSDIENVIYGQRVRSIKSIDNKKYSKIILNGVLDYLEEDEAASLIEDMKNHLEKDGSLIITLTNKYSIKLLSGTKQYGEDEYFTSLTSRKMFSKTKISNLLNSLSLEHSFYYPLPGYLITSEIFSDDYLPEANSIRNIKDSFIGKRYVVFDDDIALSQALADGNFELFTPAYLIAASIKE